MTISARQMGLFLLCQFFVSQSQALDLLDAYTMARDNDPTFKAAFYAHQAGQEYAALGRSNLLPAVTASYSRYKNNADIDYENNPFRDSEQREYTSQTAAIQLRQPIINFDGYARYQQGKAQTLLSDQEFAIREQELILRVFNKYAAVLYFEDMLALAKAKREAYYGQKQANLVMFKNGEGTKTDILESQAKFDMAEAEIVEAHDLLNNAWFDLNKMLGSRIEDINPLITDFELLPVYPVNFDEWQTITIQSNLELAAQRYALEVAKQEVKRSQAAHMPRLDAVASLHNNISDTTNTYNQEALIKSIGLQLTVPLYSGGAASARVRQTKFNLQQSKSEFDERSNAVLLELQKQYNLVLNATHKLKALRTAVNSAALLVKATRKSIIGGTRTNLDVLNAESQLFEAKGDLYLARYNYLQSYLSLRKVAGTLSVNDLELVASRFHQ